MKPFGQPVADILATLDAGATLVRVPFWEARVSPLVEALVRTIRETFPETEFILDLPGTKLRLGQLPGDTLEVRRGQRFVIARAPCVERPDVLPVPLLDPPSGIRQGDQIICGDGDALLALRERTEEGLCVEAVGPGRIRSFKGVVFQRGDTPATPDVQSPVAAAAAQLAARIRLPWIALSFVEEAEDIAAMRRILEEAGATRAKVMPKVETPAALQRVEAIVHAGDGVMLGRGDLSIRMRLGQVPRAQRLVLAACRAHGRFSIVSTGLLTSLARKPLPCAAEVSDIVAAMEQGVNCLQLCEETAHSTDPAYCVAILRQVIDGAADEED